MTTVDLAQLLEQYRLGLSAELVILHRIEKTAARQRQATDSHDLEALNQAADDRDGLMSVLVRLEGELRDVRSVLSRSKEQTRRLAGYAETLALHREALALMTEILKTDDQSLRALAAAELARRDLARAMEQGETTLAAYRRTTITPGATLVNRRG